MAKFKAWGFWPKYMMAVPIVIGLGACVGSIVQPSLQTLVVGLAALVVCNYAAFRYWQTRENLKIEFKAYIDSFDVNVFCIDQDARRRWTEHTRAHVVKALHEVAEEMDGHDHLRRFKIRICSTPFPQRGTLGLNRGTWWDRTDTVTLAWLEPEDAPAAMQHEFAHVVLARRDNLHGDEAHPQIARLGW